MSYVLNANTILVTAVVSNELRSNVIMRESIDSKFVDLP